MRSETEMMNLILSVARQDERIRVVAMNGSRVNASAPVDSFQDFDIVFLVREIDSFLKNDQWLDVFGPRMIMQKPEAMHLFPPSLGGWFTYLMLFQDENRIDLMLIPVEDLDRYLKNDTLTRILLDKDNLVPQIPPPDDKMWHVAQPSEAFFQDSCNEFWWLVPYVVKGVCRREFLYAADHLQLLRNEVFRMLSWQVGFETDFAVSVGKNGKYLEKYIPSAVWNNFISTYQAASYDSQTKALKTLMRLFDQTAKEVARFLKISYPQSAADQIAAYVERHLSVISFS